MIDEFSDVELSIKFSSQVNTETIVFMQWIGNNKAATATAKKEKSIKSVNNKNNITQSKAQLLNYCLSYFL